ncbi:Sterol esterase 2 [Cytospora mali]|uniref:Sterol esterase 2 n=1 Tax=Cytospora mali TaxID=578113 RepID=A0A194VQ09_CYTMA|nr:Sterol esterase 2 [Valsa mali]
MTVNETSGSGSTPPHGAAKIAQSAVDFAKQAEKLSLKHPDDEGLGEVAAEAKFVTPLDPVIVTSDGNRLPGVPIQEAHKLNILKDELENHQPASVTARDHAEKEESHDTHGDHDPNNPHKAVKVPPIQNGKSLQKSAEGTLRRAAPPSHTNPLFPPLPLYGPASILRDVQCATFRVSSFFLSLSFLGVIVLGSLFTSIPKVFRHAWLRLTFQNPDKGRPFYEEEMRRRDARKLMDRNWKRRPSQECIPADKEGIVDGDGYIPTEGGPDPIKCDVGYYARRVGLDVEEIEVQTEDGFIIDLWHVYDPREYEALEAKDRVARGPELCTGETRQGRKPKNPDAPRKYPVLLIHGLLQSAGAYCVNDEQSLAFWLCKSGFDVWLGNNRCGFKPKHVLLEYSDPRMWCWNIRQMGVFDLPALASRVLCETGSSKIGLIAHSQGTTESFVALAKEQRPELGERLSVFCALAPAAYAGPLIGKMYFKFMRVITPAMFRMMFGIHAFIPIMMTMHGILDPRVYGWLGYKVFSFLFDWSDSRWDRGLRDRMFQFAPVYVSAESMRWWLGRECFAKHKCILSTKEEWSAEEREDTDESQNPLVAVPPKVHSKGPQSPPHSPRHNHRKHPKGSRAWYNLQSPPFALWVCGHDNLVDGDKLLRRFERGREPEARLVHRTVIPEYEHLDVIWAMDAEQKVFKEVREVLWRTCPENERERCRVPKGCEGVERWVDDRKKGERVRDEDEETLVAGDNGDANSGETGTGSSSEDLSSA